MIRKVKMMQDSIWFRLWRWITANVVALLALVVAFSRAWYHLRIVENERIRHWGRIRSHGPKPSRCYACIESALATFPFGGKVVRFGGDFRQMLPVIPNGTSSAAVAACVNRTPLRQQFKIYRLTTNIRVRPDQGAWSEFLLKVGDGRAHTQISIPPGIRQVISLAELIETVYESLGISSNSLEGKTILTPFNVDVGAINDMLSPERWSSTKVWVLSPQGKWITFRYSLQNFSALSTHHTHTLVAYKS